LNWLRKLFSREKLQRYEVFYARNPTFREHIPRTLGEILSNYVKVADVWATSLEEVYAKMQGFNWSPRGEANEYIKRLGLSHTSMSVGDLVRDSRGNWYVCANVGFIPFKPQP